MQDGSEDQENITAMGVAQGISAENNQPFISCTRLV